MGATDEIHQRTENRVSISSLVGRIKCKTEVRDYKVRKLANCKLRREIKKMQCQLRRPPARLSIIFLQCHAAARTDKIF